MRLYGCQSSVIPMLRDSQNSTAHAWEVIRQELVDARAAVGPAETENELWQKTENLVETLAKNDSQSDAYSSTDASPTSEPPPGTVLLYKCVGLKYFFHCRKPAGMCDCLLA